MRGGDERTGSLFSYVDMEARVGQTHPLRTIRSLVNDALTALSPDFSAMYSRMGRPSIPPEKLLRAMLLQAFYSIRSERLLMERLEFDLLFRQRGRRAHCLWYCPPRWRRPVPDHPQRRRRLNAKAAGKPAGPLTAKRPDSPG